MSWWSLQGPAHISSSCTHTQAAQGARHYCTALLPTPEPRAGPHCPSIQTLPREWGFTLMEHLTLPREWGFTLMEHLWSEQEDRTALVPVCCKYQHAGSSGISAATPMTQKSFFLEAGHQACTYPQLTLNSINTCTTGASLGLRVLLQGRRESQFDVLHKGSSEQSLVGT